MYYRPDWKKLMDIEGSGELEIGRDIHIIVTQNVGLGTMPLHASRTLLLRRLTELVREARSGLLM